MNPKGAKLQYFGATDVGLIRDHNEDSFIIIDLSEEETDPMGTLFMVADGMGGANAGEVASAIACKVIEERILKLQKAPVSHRDIEKYLKNLILEAHHQILQHASENPECEGMGTTAVIVWIINNYLHVVWCGDSRCYVYQKGQQYTLAPLTDDHSLVWQMVQNGELSAEEARVHEQSNIILQVLGGADTKPAPSYLNKKLEQGKHILLCSDGLNGMLSDAGIQQILEQHSDVVETTEALIDAARQAGGTDNITVIFAEVESLGSTPFMSQLNKSPKLKRRWAIMLAFTLLLAILVYVVIARSGNKAVNAKQEEMKQQTSSRAEDVPDHAEDAVEVSETKKEVPTTAPAIVQDKEAVEAEQSEAHTYDFHAALIQLNETLEGQITSTKKLIEGCESCSDDPKLENVNESLAATHDLIKNQIAAVNANLPIENKAREKLSAISQSVHASYDMEKQFGQDSLSEQEYMINTMHEVILKIGEQLETLTAKVQEKN